MAQRKRAEPITQRSEDQNLALLVTLLLIKRILKKFNFFDLTYIPPIKLKKNGAICNRRQARENSRNKNIDRLYMALSTYWCPRGVKS